MGVHGRQEDAGSLIIYSKPESLKLCSTQKQVSTAVAQENAAHLVVIEELRKELTHALAAVSVSKEETRSLQVQLA